MKKTKDLDFFKMIKRTLHQILKDPATRKEFEQLLMRAIIKYSKKGKL